jgi:hypothetical protein
MKQAAWVGVLLLASGCARPARQETAPSPAPPPTAPAQTAAENTTVKERESAPPKAESLPGITATVKPYTISPSLREVVNLRAFTKAIPLQPGQQRLLAKNLFVCTPTRAEQLFHIYENNDYLNLPSFVTTDTVLQVYHVFYDFTLRTVETQTLTPALRRLTQGMLAASLETWKQASVPKLKQAALKNVAYFGVAGELLGPGKQSKPAPELPAEAAGMVRAERALIDRHAGFAVGAIFPYKVDYSQFVPRGHYTRSEALKRFFRSMMWYGLAPFALRYQVNGNLARADEPILQGLLLVRSLYQAGLEDKWATVYEPTAFYVGTADDLTPAEWKRVSDQTFGKDPPAGLFMEQARFEAFVAALQKSRAARIQQRVVLEDRVPAPDLQLRFMGQRYLPDSEILQRLSRPVTRPFPSGLDVMAVLGSPRAEQILDTHPKLYNAGSWTEYEAVRARLSEEFARIAPKQWTANLYRSWLHALRPLLEPVPPGYPSFMRGDAWQDKSLHTALASWAELRHDTILYGKQSAAECGDGEEKPFVKGYVEPNVPFYDRLLKLTRQSREGLTRRKLLSDTLKDRFEQFDDLLTFLKTVSEKELRNQKLTEDQYNQIRYIGGELERLTLSVMTGSPTSWELVSQTDRDMAVVADVHTAIPKVLEEGVGHANEILAIVPVEGRPMLTRGAVFSYYEFKRPLDDRLTDEQWQAILKADRAPDPPAWTRSFLLPGRPRRLKSDEMEVYSSGC